MPAPERASRAEDGEKTRTLRTSVGVAGRTGTLARAVAKKVRTPPPPRRVQAPQRRETRKAAGVPDRSPWLYAAGGAVVAGVIAAIVLAVVLINNGGGGGSKSRANVAAYNQLPGIRKTKAPWPWQPEYAYISDRLAPLGLTTLAGHEGLVMHIHAHLDIYVDGKHVTLPALVGINPAAQYLTELHTHDATGVIHVEAQKKGDYTLGQFVAEWGVFLNGRCIGAYCNGLKWYVNGHQQTGNPQNLVFKAHQEIVIFVGKPPKEIPKSYTFPSGE
jgi:hypothetical protein